MHKNEYYLIQCISILINPIYLCKTGRNQVLRSELLRSFVPIPFSPVRIMKLPIRRQMPMKYMTVLEASKKWGISDRRVRFLCSQGRIRGIIQQGRRYLIPETTEKPRDERIRKANSAGSRKYNDFTRLDFLKGMISEQEKTDVLPLAEEPREFMVHFSCNTAALEGSTLSEQQCAAIFQGHVVADHPLREHLEVLGIKDAMTYAIECVKERKPLSQNVIRSVHQFLCLDQPFSKGKYRRVRVRISNTESSPVYLDLMEPRINDLLNANTQRKKVMHPIERIARFYLEFEGIHPFEEGNGRTACILLNLELMQNGYPPIDFSRDDQETRILALQDYESSHNPAQMIRLISKKAEEEMEHYLNRSREKRSKKTAERQHADPSALRKSSPLQA